MNSRKTKPLLRISEKQAEPSAKSADLKKRSFRAGRTLTLLCFLLAFQATSYAQSVAVSSTTPLKEIMNSIREQTGYYFLYRESQVAGIELSLPPYTRNTDSAEILEQLKTALAKENLNLLIDEQRKQVLLVQSLQKNNDLRTIRINGYVLDASTGERLPFASISWETNGRLKGVTTNSSGLFSLREETAASSLDITFSYLGFEKRTLSINPEETSVINDLAVRLEPNPVTGQEIIISGFSGYNPSDSLLSGIMRGRPI